MRIHITKPLFAWEELEDSPTLDTLRALLALLPDGPLLRALTARRGRGRNDYPVRVLWGVVVLTIVCRHVSVQACLDELRRNPALRHLIGIDSEAGVPKKWNLSRFLSVLGQQPYLDLLAAMFDALARRLGAAVSDLGVHTAGDATGLSARPDAADADGALPASAEGLDQPSGGRKAYGDDAGNVTKLVEWFGYKLHLLVDVKHEVALAWRVTSPKTGDNEALPALVAQARRNLPENRMKTLAYDKAADDNGTHEDLTQAGVKPVIRNRALWRSESERMLPGHDGRSNVVYDEAGTVHCYDTVGEPPVRRAMAYIGHEARQGTLKYRCPARHGGWSCASDTRCNAGKRYGKTVRVRQEIDLRRFPPIPRATKQFERLYKGRTAVERVNARFKVFWGADDGNITGAARFHAFVAAVVLVHIALATLLAGAPRWEGTLGQTRLTPVAEALHSPPSA